MSIQYTKVPLRYIMQHFLHYIILPVILVGSDLLIGFYGYIIGSTDETWSMVHLAEILIVALFIIIVVEIIKRLDNTPNINPHIQHALHFILLPVILVGSDLLIGFYGHYRGSTTKNIWSTDALFDYLQTMSLIDFGFILGFALFIVVVVEVITRLDDS